MAEQRVKTYHLPCERSTAENLYRLENEHQYD